MNFIFKYLFFVNARPLWQKILEFFVRFVYLSGRLVSFVWPVVRDATAFVLLSREVPHVEDVEEVTRERAGEKCGEESEVDEFGRMQSFWIWRRNKIYEERISYGGLFEYRNRCTASSSSAGFAGMPFQAILASYSVCEASSILRSNHPLKIPPSPAPGILFNDLKFIFLNSNVE